jgi:hypothetical protein
MTVCCVALFRTHPLQNRSMFCTLYTIHGPMSGHAVPTTPPIEGGTVIVFEYFCVGGVPTSAATGKN